MCLEVLSMPDRMQIQCVSQNNLLSALRLDSFQFLPMEDGE